MTPTTNPKGRLDILLLRLAEEGCKKIQASTGVDLFESGGVKEWLESCIFPSLGVPSEPIDIAATIRRNLLGIETEAPRVKHRRRARVR